MAGKTWQTINEQESSALWGANYGNDSNWNVNGNAHNGTAYTDGLPAAGLRGGRWNSSSKAGAFSVGLDAGPPDWRADIGSRCCRGR